MRASTADRDRAIKVIKASFAEGRLTRPELDSRVGQALVEPYFPELMALIADLPVGPFGRLPWHPATPAPPPGELARRQSRSPPSPPACRVRIIRAVRPGSIVVRCPFSCPF